MFKVIILISLWLVILVSYVLSVNSIYLLLFIKGLTLVCQSFLCQLYLSIIASSKIPVLVL